MRRILRASLALFTAVVAGCSGCNCGTIARIPSPVPTLTATPIATVPTATPTPAIVVTPSPTPLITGAPAPTSTPTPTPAPTATATPTPTLPIDTPTATPTPLPTFSATPLVTPTPLPTFSPTPVPSPLVAGKSFDPPSITSGGQSTITITITNPNSVTATGVGIVDDLPPTSNATSSPDPMVIATSSAQTVSTSCGPNAVLFANVPGSTSAQLGSASIAPGATCTITFNVVITSGDAGTWTNTTNGPTAGNLPTGLPASASLTETVQVPSLRPRVRAAPPPRSAGR